MKKLPFFLLTLSLLLQPLPAQAQPAAGGGLLVPVGGGYSDVYPGIVAAMLDRAQNRQVRITVVPASYSSNAERISAGERTQNLQDAERRRVEIEAACGRAAPAGVTCTAEIAPIFVRADAEDVRNLRYFESGVTAVFLLGGDQAIAMQVLAGTPVEKALAALYDRGGVVAGTSAGGGMQSRAMIAGYSPNFAAANSLHNGAALLWQDGKHSEAQRGLDFGAADVIFDQHFFQRGRLGRLLEAIVRPAAPHVGAGIDAYTGLRVESGQVLTGVFGLYTVAVLDAATLDAAGSVQYVGEPRALSLRNVLVHLLAPGEYSFDLAQRRHSLAPPPQTVARSFAGLALPAGAGPLLIAGGGNQAGQDAIYDRFAQEIEPRRGPLLVVAAGFPNDKPAQRAAEKLADNLVEKYTGSSAAGGAPLAVTTQVLSSKGENTLVLDEPYAAIVVLGRDQSLLDPSRLQAVRAAWLAGTPLLLDGAAAAIAGQVFSRHGPPAEEGDAAEIDAQRSFLAGRTVIVPGLDLLPVTIEPQVLESNRWGRLFSLAYTHSRLPAFAVGSDTALLVSTSGAAVLGDGAVIALDLRRATRALGSNQAYVVANGLLDVFAPGEQVVPASHP